MKNKIEIIQDDKNHQIVLIPEIMFKGKRSIDWKSVEKYLKQHVGKTVKVFETGDMVYLGVDFPNEFKGSNYTKKLRGARAKVKANTTQGILKMVEIATRKRFVENKEEKHKKDAKNGWYYFTTRFALPLYIDEKKSEEYNIYSACLLINYAKNEKLYLYDLVDIQKQGTIKLNK